MFQDHNTSSLVIISLILISCLFEQAVLLLGEIRRWSLLGLKELTRDVCPKRFDYISLATTVVYLSMRKSYNGLVIHCKQLISFPQSVVLKIKQKLA